MSVRTLSKEEKFARLGRPKRIWAIAAIHGDVDRLHDMHRLIGRRFRPGERLVYLGNYVGPAGPPIETIDELLAFRRALLALPGMLVSDIVYLRGRQEEMWHKLLQVQFATSPVEVLTWMQQHGLDAMLAAYRGDLRQGITAARQGVMALTRWTKELRDNLRAHPGHDTFFTVLRRAALTEDDGDGAVLLVHAGLEPSRTLAAQGDAFWWGGADFSLSAPFENFRRVVRGYDPNNGGVRQTDFTLTIDDGCGFGGKLACACLSRNGQLLEMIKT